MTDPPQNFEQTGGGSTKCLCIVSFEDALWSTNNNTMMPHARGAVRHCADERYFVSGIGIATTNSSTELIKNALKTIDGEVFDDQLLSSPALQADLYGVKTLGYRRIISYFNASSFCTMVFDTASRRIVEAKAAGVSAFDTVDENLGWTPGDVDDAEDDLGDDCMCHSAPSAQVAAF